MLRRSLYSLLAMTPMNIIPENFCKKPKQNFQWLALSLVFLFCACLTLPAKPAYAANASLYLSPSTGTFLVGSAFDVSVFVDTAKNNINAVRVDIKFDPQKLQITNPATGKSFISVWVAQPTFSNSEGTISFQGGTPDPGINTSSGLVSTISFRAIAPGKTIISILDSSQVLLNDGLGTDITGSRGKAIFDIALPPPEGPKVFSTSHPDPNRWYKNNNPKFDWEKEEGVSEFSYSLDQDPHGVPDNTPEGNSTAASFNDVGDGLWYFHIKARKGDVWGGTSHYLVQIDNSPPAVFKPVFDPKFKIPDIFLKNPVVSFLTTDAFSGIDHYEVKVVNLSNDKEAKVEFLVEAVSPYRLPISESGEYEVIVKAYDNAGNWQDAASQFRVVDSVGIFFVTNKGISLFGIYLSWWWLILCLIILTILALVLSWWWRKKHRTLDERLRNLEQLKAKIAKNEQEIRSRLQYK